MAELILSILKPFFVSHQSSPIITVSSFYNDVLALHLVSPRSPCSEVAACPLQDKTELLGLRIKNRGDRAELQCALPYFDHWANFDHWATSLMCAMQLSRRQADYNLILN